VLALIVIITVTVLVVDRRDRGDGAAGADRVVSGPLGDRREATMEVLTGATSITVRVGDLGDRLYRAATPAGSGLVPAAVDAGERVQVHLTRRAPDGPDALDLQLSSRVRWNVRIIGGAVEEIVDLGQGNLAGLDIVGGATRIEVRLPRPQGTVPVRMSGGANQFLLHAPGDTPVRVRLGSGAGNVSVDGSARSGVAAGTAITQPGWDQATDRYDIDAVAGVSALTVDRWSL